ncbi:MAG: protein kinase [Deltaproteobacteria bacterium]|nr:protein kinase [Deltaproteobacteria bacterium]
MSQRSIRLWCALLSLKASLLFGYGIVKLNPRYERMLLHDDAAVLGVGIYGIVSLTHASLLEPSKGETLRQVVLKKWIKGDGHHQASNEFDVMMRLSSQSPYFAEPIGIISKGDVHERSYQLVMEYGGQDLQHYVMERGGTLPIPEVMRIGYQLALALEVLASNEVCHSDLKPANLTIRDNQIKIIDWGSSRALGIAQRTMDGTPIFSSPELIEGQACSKSDMFSVGLILYFLTTGKYLPEELRGTPFPNSFSALFFMANTEDPEPSYAGCFAKTLAVFQLVPELAACKDKEIGFRSFLRSMVHPTPSFRPSHREAISFFASHLH